MRCEVLIRRTVPILGILVLLAGCGPTHVTVPDTRPPLVPAPAAAMRPCPQGEGQGLFPDIGDGSRASVLRAAREATEMWAICIQRHRTLREHIKAALEEQRQRPD